jgi:hypothetical protein
VSTSYSGFGSLIQRTPQEDAAIEEQYVTLLKKFESITGINDNLENQNLQTFFTAIFNYIRSNSAEINCEDKNSIIYQNFKLISRLLFFVQNNNLSNYKLKFANNVERKIVRGGSKRATRNSKRRTKPTKKLNRKKKKKNNSTEVN